MRLLELSDVVLMDGVKNSVDSLAVILPSRRIGKLNKKSAIVMKEALLLDFSHNCFVEMQEEFLTQFPQSWWFLFRDNHLERLIENPPRLIGLLDISENKLTLDSLLPFGNSFILRLNIHGNPSLSSLSRDQILKQLHQVWVINDDFVKTEETTTWGGEEGGASSFLSGGWQVPQIISDKQRDLFDVVMNEMPEKNQLADYFKLDYLLDDYSYQAFVHNSAPGTVLGVHKPMPTVNCNDILMMRHDDRLDLAVLLTSRLYYRVPELVFKDTMEKLLVSYMSLKEIHDLSTLPAFAITALISLIVRISRRELLELEQHSALISKQNIPGLVQGKALFAASTPPSRDSSGFRFLKSVRHFLSRDLVQVIPKHVRGGGKGGGGGAAAGANRYSALELEILRSLNDIPTKATFPATNTRAYLDWIPFIARHTLVMMTKVPSCPPLTRCQTSKSSQQTYDQLEEILSAASMTYEDMNITINGPAQDGRGPLAQSKSVLAFGVGLPTASCSALTWNKPSALSREYIKPWSERSLSQPDNEDYEMPDEHMQTDKDIEEVGSLRDLSVGGDDLSETSNASKQIEPRDKSPKIPYIRVSSAKEVNPYTLNDDLHEDRAVTPSSVQQDGRPWSMSQQSSMRTKSLENMYLGMNDSSALEVSEQCPSPLKQNPTLDTILSPLEAPTPHQLSPEKLAHHRPRSPAIVSGFSAPAEPFNQFVLSSPRRMEHWRATAGKEWKDIDLAPVLVHPLSKYPVYIKRKSRDSGIGPELEGLGEGDEDSRSEYDVLAADKKDWQQHVKEHQPNTFETEDHAFAKYQHQIYQENKKHDEIQSLADQMKKENMSQSASSNLIINYMKKKDPNESRNELLREMGTTRNLRFQQEMAMNLRKEIMRQRREEEYRRHFSYRGIKLEGGSSVVSQESYATLETKNSRRSDVKLGVDLQKVSWNKFVKKEPRLPSLETVCAMPTPDPGPSTFLTEPAVLLSGRVNKSRPSSPSKAVLSFVPTPVPIQPDHAFLDQQEGMGEDKGWDTSIPLAKHVSKALKYSSVYTNSGEVDWGVMLTSGKAPAAWFPRQEKPTFTLAEQTPVNVARIEQLLKLTPRSPPPPHTSGIYPILPKHMNVAASPPPPSTEEEKEEGKQPFTLSSRRPTSRQRTYRPDKSRKKVPQVPKRVTAPAYTSNFTNHSLQERDPIFIEITEVDDSSVSTYRQSLAAASVGAGSVDGGASVGGASGGAAENLSIFNGSVESTDIQQEYIRSLTISATSITGESKSVTELSPSRRKGGGGGGGGDAASTSVGSTSLSCGSVKRELAVKKAADLKRQQQEELSLCSTKGSQLHDRSSFAIPVLKVPPNKQHEPALNFTTRKNPYHPRVLAQIDPLEAPWVQDKAMARERLSGLTPISVCRPVTNTRPINPTFRIKKSKLVSKSINFDSAMY